MSGSKEALKHTQRERDRDSKRPKKRKEKERKEKIRKEKVRCGYVKRIQILTKGALHGHS